MTSLRAPRNIYARIHKELRHLGGVQQWCEEVLAVLHYHMYAVHFLESIEREEAKLRLNQHHGI